MSRPAAAAILAPLRPALRPQQPIASSSTCPFSTSSPAQASRAKQVAKRKKAHVLSLRSSREAEDAHPPNPVLGHVAAWEGCRLQRTILTPEAVWSGTPSSSSSSASTSAEPRHYLPGLTPADREMLFGAVPHTTLTLGTRDLTSEERVMRQVVDQENQVTAMQKILDLRNASKQGIEVVNRQRIIDEFGRKRVVGADGSVTFEGEAQSGGSEVQAALLTQKIRNMHQHLAQNPRDIHNKRPLRTLVHQRAKILKYLKRTQPGHYDLVLRDLGLERRAVEGELIV